MLPGDKSAPDILAAGLSMRNYKTWTMVRYLLSKEYQAMRPTGRGA